MFQKPIDSDPVPCPYIEGEKFTQRYAVLKDLTGADFDFMLEQGWRHFGYYFFMPNCNLCSKCTPIRTLVGKFIPTKSQRKLFKKNSDIKVELSPLHYRDDLFEIYKKHSKVKFNQESSKKEFKESFFGDSLSGNSRVSNYYLEGRLIAFGVIDIGESGISSVYFCYDPDFSKYSLGTYSALKEIELARELGKDYYYMGYYIQGNRSMEYKSKFGPLEKLDWDLSLWVDFIPDRIPLLQNRGTLK